MSGESDGLRSAEGAYGIRTRVSALRGRCPRPLDECAERASSLASRARQQSPRGTVLHRANGSGARSRRTAPLQCRDPLRGRLMVGRLTLDQVVKVRVLAPQLGEVPAKPRFQCGALSYLEAVKAQWGNGWGNTPKKGEIEYLQKRGFARCLLWRRGGPGGEPNAADAFAEPDPALEPVRTRRTDNGGWPQNIP